MRIVCLGWGSLIWNPEDLPLSGSWQSDGPGLPVEFARESGGGRMTLVLVRNTEPVPVLWSELNVANLDEAKLALAERERVSAKNIPYSIGFWTREQRSKSIVSREVSDWAVSKDFDAVVWTALKPGFKSKRGVLPSVEDILQHISKLAPKIKVDAEDYVRKAPEQIRTKYRGVLEQKLGWFPNSVK